MMMMNMTMQMQETFYSDLHFEFLFDNLHVDNTAKYSGAMVVLFLLAIALSAMNFVVNHLSIQYRT